MADVVITEFMDEEVVDSLRRDFHVLYDPELVESPLEIRSAIGDCRGLIVRNRTVVDGSLLEAAPRLIAVGRLGVGLDNIDLAACQARGVVVHPASGANSEAVAEYVIGSLLVLFRGVFRSTDRVASGEWPRTDLAGREIAGKRLGLVGFGAIARLVAEKAAGLGMRVAAYDPFLDPGDPCWDTAVRQDSLEDLLATADALSLHVPLVEGTRHLLDNDALALLPPRAIVVNTSRGGIVDEVALVELLRNGTLGGAAIDVFADEPLDADSGALFAGVPNLLLTPHIAGITEESNRRVSAVTAEHVRQALKEHTP